MRDCSRIILSRPERFRELKMNLAYTNPLATFIRGHGCPSSAFTQLGDLTIDCYEPGIDITFAAAGRLHKITAQTPFTSWEARKNFAPWEQLTSLDLRPGVEGSFWVLLAAHCRNLENATFSINTIVGDPLPTVNVTMAHPTSLSVTFAPDDLSSIRVFDSFTFPVLTSLHMRAPDLSWRSPEHFYDQLRSLRMLNFIGPSEDLLKLLHHTPSLESLHVSTGGWIFVGLNPLLFGLTVAGESDPIVPDLKRLIITAVPARWSATSDLPPVGPLLKMVSSRTRYHTSVCP